VRPLTKKIDTKKIFFIFERQKRWKYHLNDFSIRKFRKILKELNIKISPEIEKRKEGVVIAGNSYFLFIDEIKSKSTKLIFLGHFYKYFLEFILSQYNKAKRTSKDLVSIISAVKELNFKMSVIDFVHNLIIKNLKEFLILKYNLTESKNLAYFIPSLSFTTQSFLLSVNNNKKIPNFYDQELLGRLDKHSINKLISNVEANQKRISKTLKAVRGEQLRYFVMLKKLIWLRDLVDYYYDAITSFYGNSVCLVLSRENIKYPFRDSLELCRFSMNKIKEIGKNKVCPESDFLSEERQKMASQEKQALPLKGVIASQGNFSGIARIIKDFSDIKRVGPKDILVSQYTRPSLVVGMAICKGIITEEGGLTSHAAIVSRELGKPCLIGVERCTNAIKDGDKIKVVDGKIYKLK
jgi:phosphohistidine swiveling domain-containing protein